jgi:hypothetical protein
MTVFFAESGISLKYVMFLGVEQDAKYRDILPANNNSRYNLGFVVRLP